MSILKIKENSKTFLAEERSALNMYRNMRGLRNTKSYIKFRNKMDKLKGIDRNVSEQDD